MRSTCVAIIGTAHLCAGSLGSAVLLVSFGLRLAMVPLTLRIARRARVQQLKFTTLKPEIERIRRRHRGDPARPMREMQAFYRKHALMALLVSALTGIVVAGSMPGASPATPGAPAAMTMAVIVGVATLVFAWTASAAVALSVGGGALVSGVQGLLLARDRQRAAWESGSVVPRSSQEVECRDRDRRET